MQIRALFEDDDAVSPVIGVILMVAITVILAAVIGAFVLGFGSGQSSAPSASFDASDNGTNVTFTLQSAGETLSVEDLEFGADAGNPTLSDANVTSGNSELDAGATIVYSGGGVSDGNTISVVWNDGDTSSTLYEHEVTG